jgi:enterochelin esterase-like enzyme
MAGGYFLGPPASRRRRPRGRPLVLLALIVAVGLIGAGVVLATRSDTGSTDRHGASVQTFTVDSKFVKRKLDQQVAIPKGGAAGRPLLVLLHGRGSKPGDDFSDQLFSELARLGDKAPVVIEVNGGENSYYHDRGDGRWGSYVWREVIPQAVARLGVDGKRIAIGGISMGGFGALDLARLHPKAFCAVGGHSAALWRRAGDTPPGAFDSAADFARHDVYAEVTGGARRYRGQHIWLDTGQGDPFRPVDTAVAQGLRKHRVDVTFHLWKGGHDRGYWDAHMASYLRFYAAALDRCR